MRLVAINFETADPGPDSACAIGLVVVEDGRVGDVRHRLIRPPRRRFRFTSLHGIGWRHVADRPGFGAVWAELAASVADADYLVAHNAAFAGACTSPAAASDSDLSPRARWFARASLAGNWPEQADRLGRVCEGHSQSRLMPIVSMAA